MKTYIIAEAGVNHNGNIELAKKLVDKAIEAGADCIKFQTFVAKNIVTRQAKTANYQQLNMNKVESQFNMLKGLELSFEDFIDLNDYCEKLGIEFLSTGFDLESINFLDSLNMKIWKIPSGDINNLPYLVKIAELKKPVILSTGMSNIVEIEAALEVLRKYGTEDITVLHCTTEYPAPYKDVNLNAMKTIEKEFNLPVGYSDHTNGIEVAIAAVAMGATVIEKHFTLDRQMEGPDHKASLEPEEFKAMVKAIRNIEQALGNFEKKPTPSEMKNIEIARKSLVASRRIEKGEKFSEENLTVKRPGKGISPMNWFEIIGQTSKQNFEEDELIEW
ncbi:N-acetylneuraminate synthase [Planococcus sp. A6]|uniref:N-acetylneuraminate synthase n=1 Tax=Planococcus sp. A6 TaxID=2992760 RepID=UPI00237B445F|nr:N-acetylneuraminate synthase [Planococcus sp. A6]MDE0582106.1 N-acetylneuraminate synthase [Planococcus sp. A6]